MKNEYSFASSFVLFDCDETLRTPKRLQNTILNQIRLYDLKPDCYDYVSMDWRVSPDVLKYGIISYQAIRFIQACKSLVRTTKLGNITHMNFSMYVVSPGNPTRDSWIKSKHSNHRALNCKIFNEIIIANDP